MANKLKILVESRIRWKVYVRFGGEYMETYYRDIARRWVLSLHYILTQSLLLQLFRLMYLELRSTDPVNPVIWLRGIPRSDLVDVLRNHVQEAGQRVRGPFLFPLPQNPSPCQTGVPTESFSLLKKEKLQQIRDLFSDIQAKQAACEQWHLPDFTTGDDGFMLEIVLDSRSIQFETRWVPNIDLLMEIADHYEAGLVGKFQEMAMVSMARHVTRTVH